VRATMRREYDVVLRIGYVGVTALCGMMFVWIWVAPGSCSTVFNAIEDKGFATVSDGLVPRTLITKYRKHLAVCVAHVLPASVWSAIAPFQIHPAARKRFPRAHRYAGRLFLIISASMTYGYYLINKRGLHFHANDFPTIPTEERTSFWIDYGAVGLSFVHVEHFGAMWFAFTAMRAYIAVATPPRNFTAHRAWTWRHIASGLAVALQRVFLFIHHGAFRVFGATASTPELMKPIFSDSLVYGGVFAAVFCEVCILRAHPARARFKTS
jgi:hypothetical protein